ncbi:hypothetical protein J7L06_10745, partial [Candidatus Bathyarchaeota archaeon]|nr:hypothetical protein [Candidatus Bathyarchaeota archaeon]
LKDGSIVKFKPVLMKVFETDAKDPMTGETVYAYEGHNVVTVRSPEDLRGKPSEHIPPPPEALKMPKEEVEVIETVDPSWNIYELENGKRVKTKAVITNVYKIKDVFDRYGNPYYVVTSQMVVSSSPSRLLLPELSATEDTDIHFPPRGFRFLELDPLPPVQSTLLAPRFWPQEKALPDWTKPPIKFQEGKLVIDPREMTIGHAYQVKYQGRVHLFIKRAQNIIDVYEVIEE